MPLPSPGWAMQPRALGLTSWCRAPLCGRRLFFWCVRAILVTVRHPSVRGDGPVPSVGCELAARSIRDKIRLLVLLSLTVRPLTALLRRKFYSHGDHRDAAPRSRESSMSLPPVSPPLARLLYRSLLRTSARGKRPECLPMLVRDGFEPATPARADAPSITACCCSRAQAQRRCRSRPRTSCSRYASTL